VVVDCVWKLTARSLGAGGGACGVAGTSSEVVLRLPDWSTASTTLAAQSSATETRVPAQRPHHTRRLPV
jgi:hypothetical protein